MAIEVHEFPPDGWDMRKPTNKYTVMTMNIADAIKRLLRYSFEDTRGVYETLTQSERDCITREEYDELIRWTYN